MNLIIAIPTVPSRADILPALLTALSIQMPAAPIRIGVGGVEPRNDFPRLMARAAGHAEWVLQIEDDVALAPTFAIGVARGIEEAERRGAGAITFFSRARRDPTLCGKNGEEPAWYWRGASSHCMNQCIAVRSSALAGIEEYAVEYFLRHSRAKHSADLLLGGLLSRARIRMLVQVPSLVQHRPLKSTIHPGCGVRQSESYRAAFGEVQ